MSTPLDLVVRGGTVIDAMARRRVDVGVKDGVIAELGADLPRGLREIDATGLLVLPGGVDVHTHLDQVSAKGSRTADDFYTGTRSAAYGGTTTVLAFAAQAKGERIVDVVDRGLASAAGSVADAGVHLIVTDFSDPDAAAGLAYAVSMGITSLKVFLTYEKLRLADAELLTVLAAGRDLGMTVMVHAEHHGMISYRTAQLVADEQLAPSSHLLAHSRDAEAAGVSEVAMLAEYLDMPVYLVHLSSSRALVELRQARARGVQLVAETCPHYLFLDESRLSDTLTRAVQSMCSPPLRDGPDRDSLWAAIKNGEIDVISSDHAPYRLDSAKLPRGALTTFTECANGIPGVEVRMPLMMSEALTSGRIAVEDVVRLCCAQPARALGLWPRKGSLGVGSDADIAVWDPGASWTVTSQLLHDNMDHTPYEGTVLRGAIREVVSRGRPVVGPDLPSPARGSGRYLGRTTHQTDTDRHPRSVETGVLT